MDVLHLQPVPVATAPVGFGVRVLGSTHSSGTYYPGHLIQVISFLSAPESCSLEWKGSRGAFRSMASCVPSLPMGAGGCPCAGVPLQVVQRPECMSEFKVAECTWLPGFSLPLSSSHHMTLWSPPLPALSPFLLLSVHHRPSLPVWLSVFVWKYCTWRNLLECTVLCTQGEGPHLEAGWQRHWKCGNTGKVRVTRNQDQRVCLGGRQSQSTRVRCLLPPDATICLSILAAICQQLANMWPYSVLLPVLTSA